MLLLTSKLKNVGVQKLLCINSCDKDRYEVLRIWITQDIDMKCPGYGKLVTYKENISAGKSIQLEAIRLIERSQTRKDKDCMLSQMLHLS